MMNYIVSSQIRYFIVSCFFLHMSILYYTILVDSFTDSDKHILSCFSVSQPLVPTWNNELIILRWSIESDMPGYRKWHHGESSGLAARDAWNHPLLRHVYRLSMIVMYIDVYTCIHVHTICKLYTYIYICTQCFSMCIHYTQIFKL